MAEVWTLRMPTPERPHTLEVSIPYSTGRSNWKITAQETKTGAGRGCSPHWHGWAREDFPTARALANVPQMLEMLLECARGLESARYSEQPLAQKVRALLKEIDGT